VPVLWTPLLADGSKLKYRYVSLCAFIFWLVSISWISSPHPAAILGLVVLSGYLSLYWLLFFVSARSAIHLLRIPIMVAAPLCWIGCEFLRNILLGGFSFCSIEHLLFANPILIQIADLGGGYFVGGMIMSVGTGIGTIILKFIANKNDTSCRYAIVQNNRKGIFVTIICTLLIISAVIFYGYLTIAKASNPFEKQSADSRNNLTLKIAALQGNSPVSITMTDQQLIDCFKQYIGLMRTAVHENNGEGLDLIIFPETVCPLPYVVFENGATYESQGWDPRWANWFEEARRQLLNFSVEVNSPILYGISTTLVNKGNDDKNTESKPLRLNSALLVNPRPPEIKARYDKIQLVMFGEYVPFADYLPENFPLRSICQEAGRGKNPVAMPIKDGIDAKAILKFTELNTQAQQRGAVVQGRSLSPIPATVYASVNICFESTVPHHVRGQILSLQKSGQNPALLINISNSGWFNFTNQIEQHLATHVFRAVENRRPYVTATNSGYSATINCYGQITKIGKRKSAEPVIDQLAIKYWTPLYHYVGDVPAIICTIIMLAFVLYAYRIAKVKNQ
jgi:apolipoprotein N-acyltransferase